MLPISEILIQYILHVNIPFLLHCFTLRNYSVVKLFYLFSDHQSSVGQSKLSAVTLRAIQRRHEDQYPWELYYLTFTIITDLTLLSDTLVSRQLYMYLQPSALLKSPFNSHTNSAFLHSHKQTFLYKAAADTFGDYSRLLPFIKLP